MRVAVWHNLPSGGGKRALLDHVRGLLALGHTVESWRPPTADQDFLPLAPVIPEHVVGMDWPAPLRRSDEWQVTLHTERMLAAMDDHCRRCAAEIDRDGFDVLFANSCRFFRTSPIGRHVRLPGLLYLQEPYRPLYEALPRLPWPAAAKGARSPLRPSTWRPAFKDWRDIRNLRAQARDELANAEGFASILVNSWFSRESVLRAYGIEADVCYLGIDLDRFQDRGLEREDFIVGLGSVTPEKRVDLAIEAVAAIPAPRPRLVWIGNIGGGDYPARVAALASSLGVDLDLRIGVGDAELLDVLNRASLMVYAPRLEPFGLAPLEANACGVPVVGVPEGGVRETVRHEVNGLLSEPSAAGIAAAIMRLRADPELARRLGANGRRVVESEWSLPSAAARLESRLVGLGRMR